MTRCTTCDLETGLPGSHETLRGCSDAVKAYVVGWKRHLDAEEVISELHRAKIAELAELAIAGQALPPVMAALEEALAILEKYELGQPILAVGRAITRLRIALNIGKAWPSQVHPFLDERLRQALSFVHGLDQTEQGARFRAGKQAAIARLEEALRVLRGAEIPEKT